MVAQLPATKLYKEINHKVIKHGFVVVDLTYLVAQMPATLCESVNCSPLGSSVLGDFPGKNTILLFPSLGHLPDPGIQLPTAAGRWIFLFITKDQIKFLAKCVLEQIQ